MKRRTYERRETVMRCGAAWDARLAAGRGRQVVHPGGPALLAVLASVAPSLADPPRFAVTVHQYQPAPGQFIDDPDYNNPARALGPPVGAGTANGDTTKVVSLGGFGGSITLGFAASVPDNPTNPFGLDCIVFGNAFWTGGNPKLRFAEAAVIEISRDDNRNRIPDDRWYLIPGSHIVDPQGQMQDGHYILPDDPFSFAPIYNPRTDGLELFYGYGDSTPVLLLGDLNADNVVDVPDMTPEEFYTVADDPFTVGILPGSGGGDAFDIAWAIDPVTGQPARLTAFDFIRISTGPEAENGPLGEMSTEISGVSVVDPLAAWDSYRLLDVFGAEAVDPNHPRTNESLRHSDKTLHNESD